MITKKQSYSKEFMRTSELNEEDWTEFLIVSCLRFEIFTRNVAYIASSTSIRIKL